MASHQVTGRWGGRLTSRPLPDRDDSIEALPDHARATLAEIWLGRSANERRVADSFAHVRDALSATRSEPSLIELAGRAVDDELRHAEICRIVASRFAGRELAPPERLTLVVPAHATASPELRHTLHIVGQSCFNETMASAVLEASLASSQGPLVQAALRELLTDEIDHARIGWAHLAQTPPPLREKLDFWVAPLARGNLKMWRDTPRLYANDDALIAHGALSRTAMERTLLEALRLLVVPGFDRLGISTAALRHWLAGGAPTS